MAIYQGSIFLYKGGRVLNIVRRLPIDGNGQIVLHAGSVTVISSRPATNYVPANAVDDVAAPQWFADSGDTPDWERQVVSLVFAAGIIEVQVRDHFMPGDTATWADVVTVLLRILNPRELNRL